jgi:hypothetical protein
VCSETSAAAKAGTLPNAAYAMIKAVEGYGHTKGKRVDPKRVQWCVGQLGEQERRARLLREARRAASGARVISRPVLM